MPRTYLQNVIRAARLSGIVVFIAQATVSCDVHGVTSPGSPSAIVVSPSQTTIAINGTQQFSAVTTDFSGSALTVAPIWSIVSGGGTISASGLFTAGTTPGTFSSTVKATSGGISDTATVIVTVGPLATIDVTPALTSMSIGANQQYIAVGRDVAGNVVTITPEWFVVAGGGMVNDTGLFTADTVVGTFNNTVEARNGGISGTATATVTAGVLATISMTPTPVTLAAGQTQQFTAVGRDAAGHVVTMTPIWSVVTGGGSIDLGTGLFTAGPVTGTFANTVKVTSGTVSSTATVTVIAGGLATIDVSPTPTTLVVNGVQQFTAVGHDVSGNVVIFTPIWSVENGGGSIDSNTGMFTAGTAVGSFANTVKASGGGINGTATVAVTAGTLETVTVTPNPVSVLPSSTRQFTASGKDASGNMVAITPTWTVVQGGGSIDASTGLFTAGTTPGTFTNTVQASSGGIVGTASVTVTVGVLATITITPDPTTLAPNGTRQFVAVGKDANGNVIPITPTWSIENGGGSINVSTGLFTAGTLPGTFTNTVRAMSGAVSSVASVTVTAGTLATIIVTPNPVSIPTNGARQFTAVGHDVNGNVVSITPTWSVANNGGTISGAGLFTAGTTSGTFTNTITAISGGISGTATVTVTAGPLAAITVTPHPASLVTGATQQFTAVGSDANGNVVAITPAWSIIAGGGTINLTTGLFTAGTASGTFANTVQALSNGISGTATAVVTVGALATIDITPNPTTLVPNGTQQFVAVGKDANGNVVTIAPTWSIENGGGTISASGLLTAGTTTGTYANTVKALSGAISGFATATVIAGPLATITVAPSSTTQAIGTTQQFTAVGKDADGNIVVITPAWSVENGGGSIGLNTGQFTAGTLAGVFANTVRASSGAVSGTATVTVTAGALATIVITPNPDSLAPKDTQPFSAVGRDVNGNVVSITPVWSVINGGGSITSSGLFTADTVAGTFTNTVRAGSGSIASTATVTVIPGPLSNITVTPNPDSILTNALEQFTAAGRDAYHNSILITPLWTVVNGGGTINLNTGQFTAGAVAGTFINTIKATVDTVSGFATVVETAPIPPPLVPLGLAEFNGIMAGTAVTCVDLGLVSADVSISPGNTLTGFGPCVITGVQHLNDAIAAQAQIDLATAYTQLANLPCPPDNFILSNLGGTTKTAGVYCSATSIGVTGTLTLDGGGDPNAKFVFQAGTTLTTAGNIVLINGAQAKNVYWLVGSSATIGTGSQWQGNIIALTSITMVNNATLFGRALAREGAVTLGTSNVITLP